jgi:hypothetical protein
MGVWISVSQARIPGQQCKIKPSFIFIRHKTNEPASVVRNRCESPLLCLPTEIRNQILSLAISNMHIHISREPLSYAFPPGTPTLSSGSTLKDELDPYEPEKEWDRTNPTRFYNNVYPRDLASWYKYYTTRPVRLSAIDMFYQTAGNKYVKASGMNFKNIAATCRQLYAEIGVLPYLTNAFSFDSPYTFFHWLHHRLPCQRAALRELWGDVAWSHELQNPRTIVGVFKDINVEECKLFISTVALERPLVRLVNRSSVLQATNKLAWSYRKRNLLIYLHRRLFGEDPETNPGAGEIEVVFVREIWGFLDYD